MGSIRKRQGKNGKKTFCCQIRRKGTKPITATFERLTDAKEWVKKTEADLISGIYLDTHESKKHTLTDLITRFKAERFPHMRSIRTPDRTLNFWNEKLGHLTLDKISTSILKEEWSKLSTIISHETDRPLTNRTLNSYLETLKTAFNYAVKEYEWMLKNPADNLKKLPLRNQRVRFLNDEELSALMITVDNSKNKFLRLAVLLSLLTGGRQTSVLSLKWSDIDFKTQSVTYYDTKNKENYKVPLKGVIWDSLVKHFEERSNDCEYLFASPRPKWKNGEGKTTVPWINLRHPFTKAVKEANITNFKWHDMRHTAASLLLEAGGSLGEIAQILGHKTLQMTLRYAHLNTKKSEILIESVSKKFEPAVIH